MDIKKRKTPGANIVDTHDGFRLMIPKGDRRRYQLAQIDNYANLARKRFPAHPPFTLSLRARASTVSLPGTWGFGLWNDPFGLSLGFGGTPFHLPALPNAIWFFHASPENYLSFGDYSEIPGQGKPGHGFLAQAFRSPAISPTLLALAGFVTLPIMATRKTRRCLRKLANRVVCEDGVRLEVDVTEWHKYRLEWHPMRSVFWVDDALVLKTSIAPRPPLGLTIWIDNQWAAWRPDGTFGWGLLSNEDAWLELSDLSVT